VDNTATVPGYRVAAGCPGRATGRQHVDKLVRIFRRSGGDAWVLVHVEVQSQRDSDFAQRMFRYHARLYDRYQRQVVSLAVLGDEDAGWQPDRFSYGLWGCELALAFPVVKLIALDAAALENEQNIFATVILLHRDAQETRHDLQERLRRKVARTAASFSMATRQTMCGRCCGSWIACCGCHPRLCSRRALR
jgi:hypothetical protein